MAMLIGVILKRMMAKRASKEPGISNAVPIEAVRW
jgi:hypothetical protein